MVVGPHNQHLCPLPLPHLPSSSAPSLCVRRGLSDSLFVVLHCPALHHPAQTSSLSFIVSRRSPKLTRPGSGPPSPQPSTVACCTTQQTMMNNSNSRTLHSHSHHKVLLLQPPLLVSVVAAVRRTGPGEGRLLLVDLWGLSTCWKMQANRS